LFIRQAANPCGGERQQILHLASGKRASLRRRLNFDKMPVAGHHYVHIHFRA